MSTRRTFATTSWLVLLTVFCGCGEEVQVEADAIVLEAKQAVAAGDQAKAIELLTRSIEINPSFYAYSARAKIYLEQGDATTALADCEKGLEIDPLNSDLLWLQREAQKPADDRFQGEDADPPSSYK